MRLFGSRASVTADTPLDGAIAPDSKRTMGEPSPAKVQASIDRALRILAARRVAGGCDEHELQVVVQVCAGGEHYARWRKDRDRIMQRSSKQWGTHGWAERLPAGDVAVVLLPYPAGRVGPHSRPRRSPTPPSRSAAARRPEPPSSCSRCKSCGCGCT